MPTAACIYSFYHLSCWPDAPCLLCFSAIGHRWAGLSPAAFCTLHLPSPTTATPSPYQTLHGPRMSWFMKQHLSMVTTICSRGQCFSQARRSPVDRKGVIILKLDQKEASCHVLKSLQDKEGMERVKSRPITLGNRNDRTLPYQASMGSETYLALVQITWKCFQEKLNLPRSSDYQGPKPVSNG